MKPPEGFEGDQGFGRFVRVRLTLDRGPRANGVESNGTRVGAPRSCGAYGEFRRLTMRGERLSIVLVARVRALAARSSRNHRCLRLGRSGGEGPGSGLCASQQFDMPLEGQLGVGQPVSRGALVQQPAHGVVSQDGISRQ